MKNKLIKLDDSIYRVLEYRADKCLVIDCKTLLMPKWINTPDSLEVVSEDDLRAFKGVLFEDTENLSPNQKKTMYERYTLISGALLFIGDDKLRNKAIEAIAKEKGISKQTVRNYLCKYLVYLDARALIPEKKNIEKNLSTDEKNMRYALNKFFYNQNKNNLNFAYKMLLKSKYCDESGKLLDKYPSFYQFRYFYRKTKNLQNFYISRNGLKDYQKNNRPLVGGNIQNFAPNVGVGMLDSTICDIYLINEEGQIVGRPILTACIDAYSGLCCGYSLGWIGGIYSLRTLMFNTIADKVELCRKHGIKINKEDWSASCMLGKLITDKGSEYKGENFEQLADLGITIVNLPAYRPELKGAVEKFFDVIQNYYKPHLKGKGVIEPDFQERGAHDYRKDAALTIEDFEEVILRCILYYNNQRVIEDFPYTEDMIAKDIKPYSSDIWNYGLTREGANIIDVSKKEILYTLLPRTTGCFTREGLKVNKLRYKNKMFSEKYLEGKEVVVAYNPDSVNEVYLIEDGAYIEFELIESRYADKNIVEVNILREKQKVIVKKEREKSLQAQIDLSAHLEIIRNRTVRNETANTKNIRDTRRKENQRTYQEIKVGK